MDEVVARVISLLDTVEAKIQELQDKVNSLLDSVPFFLDWVIGKVQDAWNGFIAKLQSFWDWFTDKLSYAGDPGGLAAATQSWHADVGGPASSQSGRVDEGALLVDDNWSGDAASQYKQKFPGQKTAMENIRTEFVNNITLALDTIRSGIYKFWVAVAAALVALLVGVAAALTATGTIIGLPAVPVIAAGAVATCLVALGSGVVLLNSDADSANNRMAQAASFGPDAWPTFALT